MHNFAPIHPEKKRLLYEKIAVILFSCCDVRCGGGVVS